LIKIYLILTHINTALCIEGIVTIERGTMQTEYLKYAECLESQGKKIN